MQITTAHLHIVVLNILNFRETLDEREPISVCYAHVFYIVLWSTPKDIKPSSFKDELFEILSVISENNAALLLASKHI